jgi:hypothetical protein
MKEYKSLTEQEVEIYKAKLELPKLEFPYYNELIIDGKIVYKYKDDKLFNQILKDADEIFRNQTDVMI